MNDHSTAENEHDSEHPTVEPHHETSFHYQMADMKARKIVTLIRFSKLPYSLEQVTEAEAKPYLLRTTQGELYDEYEIIGYIVNDSFAAALRNGGKDSIVQDGTEAEIESAQVKLLGLCGGDIFVWARMNQQLFQLRRNLFPLLQEFYRYLLGHDRVKKSKYDSLSNRIKKQILQLEKTMNQHSDIFSQENSFLNIIVVCELFIACKFFFEQKFRKTKYLLFNRCEKISKRPEFQEVYGKASFCVKEIQPVEFEEEDELEPRKMEECIPQEIVKLAETNLNQFSSANEKRNELLYNFFKNTLKGQQSKISYFPYFWLMYDNLLCTLVQLHFCPPDHESTFQQLQKNMNIVMQELPKLLKLNVDYGFLGIYLNEKDRQYRLQGLVCLGSHPFEQFVDQMTKIAELRPFKVSRVDVVNNEEERMKVEMLWEYQKEGTSFEGIKVSLLREI